MKGEEIQEDHKRDGEMISGRKQQANGPDDDDAAAADDALNEQNNLY